MHILVMFAIEKWNDSVSEIFFSEIAGQWGTRKEIISSLFHDELEACIDLRIGLE